MKKKLLTTVLTVGMVLSLVGCGAKETTSSESVAETTVAESTTEYGTEETTEEVEETVVEEQTTETTETVEETVVEETTEEVTEETTSASEGYPTVFANDDPRTSEVTDMAELLGVTDMRIYVWNSEESPVITMYPDTKNFEISKEASLTNVDGFESFSTMVTPDGEKDVILHTITNSDGTTTDEYIYTVGNCTILISDVAQVISTAEDLQHFVDLIRFE